MSRVVEGIGDFDVRALLADRSLSSWLGIGLLGTTVGASKHRARAGNPQRLYIVPATINYRLVLASNTSAIQVEQADVPYGIGPQVFAQPVGPRLPGHLQHARLRIVIDQAIDLTPLPG